jgi:hypothetical protein
MFGIPLPYAALGGLLLALATYFAGHHYGWAERDAEMQIEVARKNEEARAKEQKLVEEIGDVNKTLSEANNALEQESSALQRAIRAGRVRLPAPGCVQATPGAPAPAGNRDEAPSESDRATLEAIAAIVAEGQRNTQQLNACIDAYNSVREQINAGNR